MKLHYIASDTKKEFDFEWKNAILLGGGDVDLRATMMTDYIPGLKNRFCPVGQEIFKDGVMTIQCFDEKTITTWIKYYIDCHNEGKNPFDEEWQKVKEGK